MPSRPTAVLFDLDGTLIDSIELILSSVRHAFQGRTGRVPTDEEWTAGIGIPLRTALARYADDEGDVDLLLARYREHQLAHHDRLVRCYDGVVATVETLRERGHPMAVVTSKADWLARRGLEHVGIAEHFATIVGCDSCTRHKPDPEPVRVALERLGYTPDEAIFVGDSVHDIAAGNAAGVRTVGAAWGAFSRAQLEAAAPTWVIEGIEELVPLLDAYHGQAASARLGETLSSASDGDRRPGTGNVT